MAAGTGGETSGTFRRFGGHPGDAGEFVVQRFGFGHPPLMQRRQPIRSHALLRQRGQLGGQLLGGRTRLPFGHNTIGQADRQRFVGVDRATGEDHVHRPALPDQPRQPDRATVDQRYPPPTAEHPEHGVLLGDSQIAPQCELQTAGDRVAADRGNHRL